MKKSISKKELLKKYDPRTYKANKNCKPVTYKGTVYSSKIQCCVLEGITRKELEEYLKDIIKEEMINVNRSQIEKFFNV